MFTIIAKNTTWELHIAIGISQNIVPEWHTRSEDSPLRALEGTKKYSPSSIAYGTYGRPSDGSRLFSLSLKTTICVIVH